METSTLSELRRLSGITRHRLYEEGEDFSSAAKTQPEMVKVFDKLKSKQSIWISSKSVMGMGPAASGGWMEFKVGRRSKAKKPRWWSEAVSLLPADGSKAHVMSKFKLWKSKEGDNISASQGDMGIMLKGIYVR